MDNKSVKKCYHILYNLKNFYGKSPICFINKLLGKITLSLKKIDGNRFVIFAYLKDFEIKDEKQKFIH